MEKQPAVYLMASGRAATLYIGVTSNLAARVTQHRLGLIEGFTSRYGIKRLVWFELHADMPSAIGREKQLKKWNRDWKLNFIEASNPEWIDLAVGLGLAPLNCVRMDPRLRGDDGNMTEVDTLTLSLLGQIEAADSAALEAIRIGALGKSGSVTALLKTLGAMSPEERQQKAPAIQGLRVAVADAIEARKASLDTDALDARLASETLDMTLPIAPSPPGSIHPVSQVMDELAEIFADLGFAVASGPEIEDDWHNFTALNIPETHPARAMHDTFYFPEKDADGRRMLLRTHTSPVQIRTMTATPPPLRIIAPGRVYRSDSDATHTPMFHQIEGLVIDKGIHLGHLRWTLETFLKAFFERDDIVLRLRPSYFPFTEPSVEVDVGYTIEKGRRVVGGADGWMEVLGSGMVHPKVLTACGLDPAEWQGFAFGTGVDRLAMLKYGMDDLRPFFDGDLRWLRHYGFRALDVPTLSGGVGA